MENLNYKLNFGKLCAEFNLGQLTTEPDQVFGGFLHRMYQLKTDKGAYAVKALNPQIMQRTTAMDNFIFSEKVANMAYQNKINALPAIASKGSCIHEVDGQYYLLFPWVQGRILPAGVIDMDCCKMMGEVLANIHNTDFSQLIVDNQNENFYSAEVDWSDYAHKGKHESLEWSYLLLDSLNKVYHWEKLAHSSARLLSNNKVISHGDLDQKNVLWDENQVPIIIDWESAGATNPTYELIDVALNWSGFPTGNLSKDAFCTIISAYRNHGGVICDNLLDVLNYGFQGKLDWLAYNIRRSLKLECTDDTEQKLGTSEAIKTLQAIHDYADFIPVGIEWLSDGLSLVSR
ncbi:aminoglycoside phosphotransferase family protein [Paenibacillus eucommiae]|uniref:Thiamine kinase-like enzyme n=1 Tax=Paenibacillus eucommiae TaxID=1355755 RepID=A0ABS4IXJ6_9BACL|nr:aminoglycoside phosphotransferase family protein [Paenibacillus eucommiae]MBP1992233.1 thiamine kinase-like enzyme [Paenibacillus eucommiae]